MLICNFHYKIVPGLLPGSILPLDLPSSCSIETQTIDSMFEAAAAAAAAVVSNSHTQTEKTDS